MVAASKSSLRRPKTTEPTETVVINQLPPPHSYPKRTRISSVSDREHIKKRRRLSIDIRPPQLRIPVRNKIPPPLKFAPPKVAQAISEVSQNGTSGSDSPRLQPEYEKFRGIEEQARAFIRGGGQHLISQDEKRSLRSHDGTSRSRSELANFIPEYDKMISLEQEKPDALTAKTHIILIDDVPDFQPPRAVVGVYKPIKDPFGASKPLSHNAHVLDLSKIITRRSSNDSLGPELFQEAHRRPERREKQAKNGEKERNLHEKVQLDRLLEELKGPDWLRVMGISGITESEKKNYEPKRAVVVREIAAMIHKFTQWKEEEKRRKIEREQALLADEEEIKEESEVEDVEEEGEEGEEDEAAEEQDAEDDNEQEVEDSPAVSPGADIANDLDALAARQLLQEAKHATSRGRKIFGTFTPPLLVAPEPHKPFTSFYSKRHLRDAAVGGHRRSRTTTAFGEPVPEMEDVDFELPDSILTEDAIRASQRRRRRRDRRTSPVD